MNTGDNTDSRTKQILANSGLQIGNPIFGQALMEKVMLLEQRNLERQRILSWAVFAAGIILFAVSLVLCGHDIVSGYLPLIPHLPDVLLHGLAGTGKWAFSYLPYMELCLAAFVTKAIIDSFITEVE